MDLSHKYRQHWRDDLYLGYELESLGSRVMHSSLLSQGVTSCVDHLLDVGEDESRLLSIPMSTYSQQTYLLAFS